jgi:hypothetical protein
MILAISFAIVFMEPMFAWYFDFFIYYLTFTVPFEIFYSKVLIKT